MRNYTIEDYKKAIKAKYEIEKESDNLSSPSQANLRDLCWEIFEKNVTQDDMSVFISFFGFPFDVTKKNQFKEQTDKFKPIGTFYKGKTELSNSNRSAINLAAILVDYHPRPFKKFKERAVILPDQPIGSPKSPFAVGIINGGFEENEDEEENEEEDEEDDHEYFTSEENQTEYNSNSVNVFNGQEGIEIEQKKARFIILLKKVRSKILERFKINIKKTAIGVAIILGLGFGVIYYAFWNKGCMQWNNDHYDIVDCSLKEEDNTIVILDPTIVNLKKIKVCDTTVFFKHGKAGVFYAKSASSVEYFNQMAPHPETGKYFRPITNYMIYKYVGPCK